jgi:hypothetical protein
MPAAVTLHAQSVDQSAPTAGAAQMRARLKNSSAPKRWSRACTPRWSVTIRCPGSTTDLEPVRILSRSPLIGRSVGNGKRELIIGKGNRSHVALQDGRGDGLHPGTASPARVRVQALMGRPRPPSTSRFERRLPSPPVLASARCACSCARACCPACGTGGSTATSCPQARPFFRRWDASTPASRLKRWMTCCSPDSCCVAPCARCGCGSSLGNIGDRPRGTGVVHRCRDAGTQRAEAGGILAA